MGAFAALFFDPFPFDGECLADMGEVEVAVKRGCDPDLARLDASMVRGRVLDEVGLFSLLEEKRDILKQRGLVGFDGEVVVGFAFFDQVVGQFTLGQ